MLCWTQLVAIRFYEEMKKWLWLKVLAWIVITVSVFLVGLSGWMISSPSVVVSRQGLLEFGITGGFLCISLLLACRGPLKILAVFAGILVVLALFTGWNMEGARFDRGGGGSWEVGFSSQLIGFFTLQMLVSVYLAWSHQVSKQE